MPVIRKSQMEKLQESAEERFVRRTVERIQEAHTFDAEGLDEGVLKERVKIGIACARSHQLTWESAITGFVYLMFTVSPDFHLRPAFCKVLDDASIADENQRMDSLFERVPEQEWEEARFQGDHTAWSEPVLEEKP